MTRQSSSRSVPRQANPRVQGAVYWLVTAWQEGQKPDKVLESSLRSVGIKGAAAELTKAALLRNFDIAEKFGCLDAEGMAEGGLAHGAKLAFSTL